MINFLQETLAALHTDHLSGKDVQRVETTDSWSTWQAFVNHADFVYDNGFGGNNIRMDLKVVGLDWWLERHEYDGSEWWEFKKIPVRPAQFSDIPHIQDEEG